ncbi:MAG: hypothetical protein WBM40_20050 [Thiohalocapsa sp.]
MWRWAVGHLLAQTFGQRQDQSPKLLDLQSLPIQRRALALQYAVQVLDFVFLVRQSHLKVCDDIVQVH